MIQAKQKTSQGLNKETVCQKICKLVNRANSVPVLESRREQAKKAIISIRLFKIGKCIF